MYLGVNGLYSSGAFRESEPVERERERESNEELAHMIMEAEKSCCLPSASRTPRKAGCMIQSESKGLRSWGATDGNVCLRAEDESQFRSEVQRL